MKYVLITGANKSIGFETAKQLLQKGYYVYLGSRSVEKGKEAVKRLVDAGLTNVETIKIDVTDAESVRDARAMVGEKTEVLDVLINNSGISGGMAQSAASADIQLLKEVFETNFFGLISVTQTFLDLLHKAPEPRIVNVTSGLGSLAMHKDSNWPYYPVKLAAYNSSKAAVNMYTITLAYELRDLPFKVNAVDPGYTATDFNHHSGPGTVEDAAARIVKASTLDKDGLTGTFFSDDNNKETGISPW
ncbi:NAD(P)-dependent dehydrogenase (short-subunit alcohol dehydrogenase family) [Pedobacter sp. UYEF25]